MEHGWERTLPIIKIDDNTIKKLFRSIENPEDISQISLLDEGCRTTNYLVNTISNKKYVLKLFFQEEQSYKKELTLFNKLKDDVPVQKICLVSRNSIDGRTYIIYEYAEGKTISQHLKDGRKIDKDLIKSVAHNIGKIHNNKFKKMGSLNENLNVRNDFISIVSLYDKYINDNVIKRLGNDNIEKIKSIVNRNIQVLKSLDYDSRLIHGDFQGTNIVILNNRVSGIIDWEFCMSGCPLMDIGQFFRYEEYFDEELINEFKYEYEMISDYPLIDEWYKMSRILDLISLIQLMGRDEDMPNKYTKIKSIVECTIKKFY